MNWPGAILVAAWGILAILLRKKVVRRITNGPRADQFHFGERAILVVGLTALACSPIVLLLTPLPG